MVESIEHEACEGHVVDEQLTVLVSSREKAPTSLSTKDARLQSSFSWGY